MRTVTATEASRSFAALLDEAERGLTAVVTRGGRRIAVIGPVAESNGDAFVALLGSYEPDDGFAADVLASRDAADLGEPAWPGD
jgi:prevent-host-death family protein